MLKDTEIVVVPTKKVAAVAAVDPKGRRGAGSKKKEETKVAEEKPSNEETKEEPAVPEKIFSEADAIAAIEPVHSFEENSLDFFNFLDCIVRISRVYPYAVEDEAILTAPELKIKFLIEKIDNEYKPIVEMFRQNREEIERQKLYQPRVVVDDEEE